MEIDLDLFGKLTAGINEMNSHMRRQTQLLQRLSDAPKNYSFRGSGIVAAGATTVAFMIGDPQLGRAVYLRQLTIGAPLWTTTLTGAAIIVRSGQNPLGAGASIDTTSVVAYAPTLPAVAQFGSQEVPVFANDNLWCVVTGATAAQQIVSSAQFEDFQNGGYEGVVTL
jgi:hypothetical protein